MRHAVLPGAYLLILAACANPIEPDYNIDTQLDALVAPSEPVVSNSVTVAPVSATTVATRIFQDPTFADAAPRTIMLGGRIVGLPTIDRDDLHAHQARVRGDQRAFATFAALLAALTENVVADATSSRETAMKPSPSKETAAATDCAFEQYMVLSGERDLNTVIEGVTYWAVAMMEADVKDFAHDLQSNLNQKGSLRTTLSELRDIVGDGQYPAEIVVVGVDGNEVTVTLNNEEEALALEAELEAQLEAAIDATNNLQVALQESLERREIVLPGLRELESRQETLQTIGTDRG